MGPRKKPTPPEDAEPTVDVHARLFATDVVELKRRAAELGTPSWSGVLRLLVRKALVDSRKDEVIK